MREPAGVNDAQARTLGWSVVAGAFYAFVAFGFVLTLDAVSTTFAPELDFVLSATAAAGLASGVLWWRAVERPGVRTRRRSAAVGATVGFASPVLAFALNPSVYGSNPNVAVDLLGGVLAAGVLGAQAHLSTFGLPVFLGALVGWSLAGWVAAVDG